MESLRAQLSKNCKELQSANVKPNEESWKDKVVKPLFNDLLGQEFHCEPYVLPLAHVHSCSLGLLREAYLHLLSENDHFKSDLAVAQR